LAGLMTTPRDVSVALVPGWAEPASLAGATAVVVDVLRATTSMLHALAAGATSVVPCDSIEAARITCGGLTGPGLLAGERGGRMIAGFDLGNSPSEFTARSCRGKTVVMTTTNGTPAVRGCLTAERILVAAFVNFSAVCEQLDADPRPVRIVCAGLNGRPALEDALFAGAVVDHLSETGDVRLDDSARLAWDTFENHGRILLGAFEVSDGGAGLIKLGHAADLRAAARIDQFAIAAEVRREPVRVEVCGAGIKRKHWPHPDPP
jgi:2-phosphosulfolactate phosphatase